MNNTIATILGLALVVVVGFFVWKGTDNDLARQEANAVSAEANLNGTGGPEEGFDPFLDATDNGDGDMSEEESKG